MESVDQNWQATGVKTQKNMPLKLLRGFDVLWQELKALGKAFICHYPDTRLGHAMRQWYWGKKFGSIGPNSIICRSVEVGGAEGVYSHGDIVISQHCALGANQSKGIYLGKDVMMARGSCLHGGNHAMDNLDIPMKQQGYTCETVPFKGREYSIVVEDGVWIGSRVVLVSGAHIGAHSVITPGSVVSSKIPPYSIVVGNPARVVQNRLKKFGPKAET